MIYLVAIAKFSYITYVTIINHLIAFSRQEYLLGPISHYYSIMEINDRNILHLYYML